MPDAKTMKEQFRSLERFYRQMHNAMELGWDGLQRPALAAKIAKTEARKILDLACGSGALTLAIATALQKEKSPSEITGVDFVDELLTIAKEKAQGRSPNVKITFQNSSANCKNDSFDAVTIAYGIRYVPSRTEIYNEALRVLKPNGIFYILETRQPEGLQKFFYQLFSPMIPFFAKILQKNEKAHKEIAEAVYSFPNVGGLKEELLQAGFKETSFEKLGAVGLYWAVKP